MATLKIAMDVHDTGRVRVLTAVQHERPRGRGAYQARCKDRIGAGPLIVRLAYHAELFKRKILPQLELPPVAGPRHILCIQVTDKERAMFRRLAAAHDWTMTGLARALVFYHWRTREEYRMSAPGLAELRVGFAEYLSFQPDRLQPWYYHHSEAVELVEARALEDQRNIVEVLRRHHVGDKAIAAILEDFARARDFRDGFEWDGRDMSPAELRHEAYKAEGGI